MQRVKCSGPSGSLMRSDKTCGESGLFEVEWASVGCLPPPFWKIRGRRCTMVGGRAGDVPDRGSRPTFDSRLVGLGYFSSVS